MEAMVKNWYANLKDGRLCGVKCKKCGNVEFPPVPVCNRCGEMDIEPIEVSPKGELLSFSMSPMGIPPYHMKPVLIGFVQLDEGPMFCSEVVNADLKNQEALLNRLQAGKVPVTIEVGEMNADISYPKIRLDE